MKIIYLLICLTIGSNIPTILDIDVTKVRELLQYDSVTLDLFQYITSGILSCIRFVLNENQTYRTTTTTNDNYSPNYFSWSNRLPHSSQGVRGMYEKLNNISQCKIDLPIGILVHPQIPQDISFSISQLVIVDRMLHSKGFNTSYIYNSKEVILSQLIPLDINPNTIIISWSN